MQLPPVAGIPLLLLTTICPCPFALPQAVSDSLWSRYVASAPRETDYVFECASAEAAAAWRGAIDMARA